MTSFHGLDFNLACRLLYDKSLLQDYRINAGFNDTPGQCRFCGEINSSIICQTRSTARKSWKKHLEKCAADNLSKLVSGLNCVFSVSQPTLVEEIGETQAKQEVVADLELDREQESEPRRSDKNCSLGSTALESYSEDETENPPPLEKVPTSQEYLNRGFVCCVETKELKQALADARSELKTQNETIEKLAAENKKLVADAQKMQTDKDRRKQDENTNRQTQKSLEDAKTTINAQKRLYSVLKIELGKRSNQANEMQEQNKLLKEQNAKIIEELYALKDKYILQLEQNQK